MATKTIWQEEFIVTSSDTDFQAKLKYSGLFAWLQDIASSHANHLGVGYHELLPREIAWVLSRMKVCFLDLPAMGEKVLVQTWPKGMQQRLFFMRDHQVNGADGRLLALASTAYVLVSTSARRMLPPTALDGQVPDNGGKSAIAETLDKIPAVEGLSDCFTIQAGYSMVDLMGHVNNARYIDWICDCFPFEHYQTSRPDWLQINFINEVKPGEAVCLQRGAYSEEPGSWYIVGMNRTSGAKAFEARLHWK